MALWNAKIELVTRNYASAVQPHAHKQLAGHVYVYVVLMKVKTDAMVSTSLSEYVVG